MYYSPSCRSKPVRPSFIVRTQIKIFLMKSESFLTLHKQQCNWNFPRPRNVIRTSVKQYMWHQWFTIILWSYKNKVIIFVFFAYKKYSRSFIKLWLNHWCHMDYFTDVLTTFLGLGTFQLHCCFHQKYLNLCLKMNEGLTGLERHESEQLMIKFSGELSL